MLQGIANIDKLDLPVVQEVVNSIVRKSLAIRYVDTAPSEVSYGEFVIMDDGVNKRIYVRTGQDNVHYATLT